MLLLFLPVVQIYFLFTYLYIVESAVAADLQALLVTQTPQSFRNTVNYSIFLLSSDCVHCVHTTIACYRGGTVVHCKERPSMHSNEDK